MKLAIPTEFVAPHPGPTVYDFGCRLPSGVAEPRLSRVVLDPFRLGFERHIAIEHPIGLFSLALSR
jgi:hypothetical protein